MAITRERVLEVLDGVSLPGGGSLVGRDLIRALSVEDGPGGATIRFVIEAATPDEARALAPAEAQAKAALAALPGVAQVSIVMTAHGPAAKAPPPSLKIGGHPTPQQGGPQKVSGVARIIAVASGKGGVGKSTVSSNLAVALARQGRRVGLLDADIHGPSQAKMMGTNRRPASPDGKIIEPLEAHGVKFISMGLMLKEDEAVIWRGPMLMGALQQLLGQVNWGTLDVLIVDLPPGTGDVQLSMIQKHKPAGAIIVSTPQDLALIDAARAIDLFNQSTVPIIGLVENMAGYQCPKCGEISDPFGHGGAEAAAKQMGHAFLGRIPLDIAIRSASDDGTPPAAGDGPAAAAFNAIAQSLITWLDNQER